VKRLALIDLPISSVRPHPRNYRRHDLAGLKRALKRGQHRTVVVRADDPDQPASGGTLLAGHGVWYASQELKRETIAVSVVECDEEEAENILAEDNRQSELGEDDPRLLAALLERIEGRGQLKDVGYSPDDLAALLREVDAPTPQAAQEAPFSVDLGDLAPDGAGGPGAAPGEPAQWPSVEPLKQMLLTFPVPEEYELFLAQVGELRQRYGIEAGGFTPVVLRAVRSQAAIAAEGER
jgi:hypothetical protein